MPIDANTFFQHAAALSDSTKLYVSQDEMSVENRSGLHGLKKLSVSARRAENAAAAAAFLNSVLNDRRYMEFAAEVRAPLEKLINEGKPLTAGQVKQTRLAMEVAKAVKLGKELAEAHKIPQGHGTSFGQFAVMRGHALNAPDEIRQAVKDYYLCEVAPKRLSFFTALPDLGSVKKNDAAQRILSNHCGPILGDSGFVGRTLDKMLADFDSFSADDFMMSYVNENKALLNMLHDLPEDFADALKNVRTAGSLLNALIEAEPFIGSGRFKAFVGYALGTEVSLNTEADRVHAVKGFMTEILGTKAAEPVMERYNFPKEFAAAIGHNPKVAERANEIVTELAGGGQIPAEDQSNEALTRAVEEFIEENKALLSEFLQMAENPPVEIDPPLTPAAMSRYLNIMLAGDVVLEPLLNDSAEINDEFMQKLADYADAVNSAAHSIKGDFGSSDASVFAADSIKLLLARRGLEPVQYNEVLARTVNKFGKLACEVQSLNSLAAGGLGGARGMKFFGIGMGIYRALEGHAKALISLMSHEQRVAFNLEEAQSAAPGDRDAVERNGRLFEDFLEKNFQRNVKPENFSPALRAFAENYGMRIPQPAAPADPNQAAQELAAANRELGKAVFSAYIANTGRIAEEVPQAFLDVFASASQKHNLEGIDPHAIAVSAFSEAVGDAVNKAVSEAAEQGKSIDTAVLHRLAETEITKGLLELKAVLEQIDNLPEQTDLSAKGLQFNEQNEPLFSAAEKVLLKECVVSSGMRDLKAITDFALGAKEIGIALKDMSSPDPSGMQLAQSARSLAQKYYDVRKSLPENFAGVQDSCKFMINAALKQANLSEQNMQDLAENLNSGLARRVAGSFLWLLKEKNLSAAENETVLALAESLTQLRSAVTLETKGNAKLDPQFYYSYEVTHPSQVPAGESIGCMRELSSFAGRKISNTERVLAMHIPPFSKEEWDFLSSAADNLLESAGRHRFKSFIPNMVASASDELFRAMAANKGKPLSPKQLWECLIGGKAPSDLNKENAGAVIIGSFTDKYMKLQKAADPSASKETILQNTMLNFNLGVSPKKMLELTKPGASLSLADIRADMSMSSLRDITEDNAFGLVTDFRRQDFNALLSFKSSNGDTLSVHPHFIDDNSNNPDYPLFKDIIAKVGGMTHSYGQMRRVLQAFSQASLVMARMYSTLFFGGQYSEHGNSIMEAAEQADGTVIMDIRSDSAASLAFHIQMKIETDGSHKITVFDMKRP